MRHNKTRRGETVLDRVNGDMEWNGTNNWCHSIRAQGRSGCDGMVVTSKTERSNEHFTSTLAGSSCRAYRGFST